MQDAEILSILSEHYRIHGKSLTCIRDAASTVYRVQAERQTYFLKIAKQAFGDTIQSAAMIVQYLQEKQFPVPPVIPAKDGRPYVQADTPNGTRVLMLFAYVDAHDIDILEDAQEAGALLGRLHRLMQAYPGPLIPHDWAFYIDRYLSILAKKAYPRRAAFAAYAQELWQALAPLPRGFSHGDLFCGNLQRSAEGKLYIFDFDTACIGFPAYDLALLCNRTDYFVLQQDGFAQTKALANRVLPAYLRFNPLSQREIDSLYALIGVYHFALQATIIEYHGLAGFTDAFFEDQLSWLMQWKAQCKGFGS